MPGCCQWCLYYSFPTKILCAFPLSPHSVTNLHAHKAPVQPCANSFYSTAQLYAVIFSFNVIHPYLCVFSKLSLPLSFSYIMFHSFLISPICVPWSRHLILFDLMTLAILVNNIIYEGIACIFFIFPVASSFSVPDIMSNNWITWI